MQLLLKRARRRSTPRILLSRLTWRPCTRSKWECRRRSLPCTRKEARSNEVEAIKKAKAVLSGADFSFMQTGTETQRLGFLAKNVPQSAFIHAHSSFGFFLHWSSGRRATRRMQSRRKPVPPSRSSEVTSLGVSFRASLAIPAQSRSRPPPARRSRSRRSARRTSRAAWLSSSRSPRS